MDLVKMNIHSIVSGPILELLILLACSSAGLHHLIMKVPQEADSALAIFPSAAIVNIMVLFVLLFKSIPLSSWPVLLGLFNIIFVLRFT
jgi:hypothetical protein